MMATELKPCPFCGGKPFVSARLPYFGETLTVAVVCEDCNAASKHKVNEEDAIEAWNRRVEKTPCDLCKFNPPSSMDGKPCTMCVADGRNEDGN
jgi:Lar family restriction alleviation protein